MEKVAQIPVESDWSYAHAGNCVHPALEYYYTKGLTNLTDLRAFFDSKWAQYDLDNAYWLREYHSAELCAKMKEDFWKMVLNGIAMQVQMTTAEMRIYYPDTLAFIDVVDEKNHTIEDWKTSTRTAAKDREYTEQLLYYCFVYRRKFGLLPRMCRVRYVRYTGQDSMLEFKPQIDDVDRMEKDHNEVVKIMEEYSHRKNPPPLSDTCVTVKYCNHREICPELDKTAIQYDIIKNGNYVFLKGTVPPILHKYIDDTFSYELKDAYFIKKHNPYANTTIRFWNKKLQCLPIGFYEKLIEGLHKYHDYRKRKDNNPELKMNITEIDQRVDTGTVNMPSELKGIELRDYQNDAVEAFMAKKFGIIEAGTGSGKTLISFEIIRRLGLKTLFIVDRRELLYQTRWRFEKHMGWAPGHIGQGRRVWEDVTIATIQSLVKHKKAFKDELAKFQFVTFDECFVSRTRVTTEYGPITMGRLYKMYMGDKKLPKVMTFNEQQNIFEYKPIERVIRKEEENLLRIFFGRKSFTMTPSHRFLRDGSWVEARDLCVGDLVQGFCTDTRADGILPTLTDDQRQIIMGSILGDGCIQFLPSGNTRIAFTHGVKQRECLTWKLSIFNKEPCADITSGYTCKPIHRGHTRVFNYGKPVDKNRSVPPWLLEDIDARGIAVWYMDDGSTSFNPNSKVEGQSIIHSNAFSLSDNIKLKNMFKKRFDIDALIKRSKGYYYLYFQTQEALKLHRMIDPYIHPSMAYKKRTTCEFKGDDFDNGIDEHGVARVMKIESLKNTYGKRGTQKRPYVYDLSVKDNHNYIVTSPLAKGRKENMNGIIAHNCHKAAAKSYYDIANYLKNAKYRLGLSATPYRDDGNDMFINATVGYPLYQLDAKKLIDIGYLTKPQVYFFSDYMMPSEERALTLEAKKHLGPKDQQYHTFYRFLICRNKKRNDAIKNLVDMHKDERILIMVKLIEHGELLKDTIPGSRYLHGSMKKSERDTILQEFENGDFNVLISTISIMAEGIDIPSLAVIINASSNKGSVKTIQMLGRVLRILDGKERAVYYDFLDNAKYFRMSSHARMDKIASDGHDVQRMALDDFMIERRGEDGDMQD